MDKTLPPKPHEANWTHEQWEAIQRRGENILVSAGAGSGKTRVLVERITARILDEENPVDIDRFLVVTFTNAAAAEMRQRISRALEQAIRENPGNLRLRRQMLLLNRAPITTLHSFCREILGTFYYLRGLDPAGRILDDTEGALLRQDLAEEVLEEFFESDEEERGPFILLAEAFSTDRGDENLQKLILLLHAFSRSHPHPEAWLKEKAGAFSLAGGGLEASYLLREVRMYWKKELMAARELLETARRRALAPGGPRTYLPNLEAEIGKITAAEEALGKPWEELSLALLRVVFSGLKPCRGEDCHPSLAEEARNLRDEAKKIVKSLKEDYFARTLKDQEADVKNLRPLMECLVMLVCAFEEKYREAKKERNVLDFSDLEHHALKILAREPAEPGQLRPSQASLYYRQRFQEVLVDEYQDINQVQEAILSLLSSPEEEAGNLFMVGDVKQSIYRFRLAEPGLFLEKYARYQEGGEGGSCIHLSRNFRSRREILSAVNFLFRQLMDREVGEIEYGEEAALNYGAPYPPTPLPVPQEGMEGRQGGAAPPQGGAGEGGYPVELLLVNQNPEEERPGDPPEKDEAEEEGGPAAGEAELEKAALEGRLIAKKIKELMEPGPLGPEGDGRPPQVYDKHQKAWRPLAYRDMVVLLRSAENWALPLLEELQRAGIPAYAEMGSGYFAAVEVEVMLSLLKVIDNPLQDIPLAAVLRSPLAGLNGEDLAALRAADPREAFYQALKTFARRPHVLPSALVLQGKARTFLARLQDWQRLAREGTLTDLIWQVYRETGYYEYVGGMPGGGQRQANLRALYDRARQYESTSYRGLHRFLRFVEKVRDKGGDLGVARALGEQEDVVRVMTVHKSKGLEFPLVFVAGLGKQFNRQDLRRDFLLHKDLGFGPRFFDSGMQVSYPTLPFLALREKLGLELLAEEMRILYVALTRAEDRLFLVASVNDLRREARKWALALPGKGSLLLPARIRSRARSPLDWLVPALLRHESGLLLRDIAGSREIELLRDGEDSRWSFHMYRAAEVTAWGEGEAPAFPGPEEGVAPEGEEGGTCSAAWARVLEAVSSVTPVPQEMGGGGEEAVDRRLSWRYPHLASTAYLAKMSVSEIKRRRQQQAEDEYSPFPLPGREQMREMAPEGQTRNRDWGRDSLSARPRFAQEAKTTAAERGTAYHTVMQYLDLKGPLGEKEIKGQMEAMVAEEKIRQEEKKLVESGVLAAFFAGPLGQRLLRAREVHRELAFSLAVPAGEFYSDWSEGRDTGADRVLVQGVIDCLFRDEAGLVLIDYKTDRTAGLQREELENRYREQLAFYSRAVEDIWHEKVVERYLFFFDGGLSISL